MNRKEKNVNVIAETEVLKNDKVNLEEVVLKSNKKKLGEANHQFEKSMERLRKIKLKPNGRNLRGG